MIATPTPPGVDPSTFKFVVNGRVVYEPFPKQVRYHQSTARYRLYGGTKGCGKLLPLDTPIPTPEGWTTIGDLRPGDVVFDADGQPTTVEWCSDTESHPEAWELEFDDGVRQVCDAGHEWLTLTNKERIRLKAATPEWRARRRAKRETRGTGKRPDLAARNAATARLMASVPDHRGAKRTTAEIVATLTVGPGTINHCVVNAGALELPEAALLVDPYVLGAWLGDGNSRGGGLTGIDPEIWQRIERAGYEVTHGRDRKSHYIRGLTGSLRALGVLGNKHIPAAYLRASRAQREALLQGLMDTDGYCRHDHGSNEFTTTSSALRDGVMELVASLGIKATCLTGVSSLRGRALGAKWRICFTTPIEAFSLPRKVARQRRSALNGTHDRRYIVAARRVAAVAMRCIGVTASSQTYLCGRAMVPTHNSKAIRFDHYIPSFVVPGMKSLILRRLKLEMERSHLRFVPKEAEMLGLSRKDFKRNEAGGAVLYFPNGSLIEFGHCNHENDIENYLSAEYDRISFDEIVTFTEEMYLALCTSCRTTIPNLTPSIGAGTNPVTKKKHSGYWAKRRWILKDITLDEDETYDPDDYDYIAALPSDNPYLNWKEYERQLSRLPPSLRAAYRDGDWDASEDGFFSEFRKLDKPPLEDGVPRRAHVVDFPRHTNGTPRYCGLDWGYMTDEGVCLWAVYADDGHLYIEDEYIFNGKHRERYIAKEIAAEIVRRNRDRGLQVRKTYCDPKMGERTGHESVETVMSTFSKHGVPCTMGERDRENGWARLRAWLRNHPDGTPFLKIHPDCKYLIRTLGELSVDDHNDHDLDTDGPDHAVDALRFLVSGLRAPVSEHEKPAPPADSVGALRAELMRPPAPAVLGHLNVQGQRYGHV